MRLSRNWGWAGLAAVLLAGCGPPGSAPAPEAEVTEFDPFAAPEVEPAAARTALQIGHTLGADTAGVEVVEFSDFGCSSCAEFATETFPALRREFVSTGRVRWRFVPLRQGFLRGEDAARAAECAALQGAFWPMHDALAESQREWQRYSNPDQLFRGYAGRLGLDVAEFGACLERDEAHTGMRTNDMAALNLGIRGTPTFFVDGRRVIGALPLEQFRSILRQATASRGRAGGAE